jgi:hypothetical protein
MSMVCPQCQGSFPQRLQCPTCGVRLEYRAGGGTREVASAGGRLVGWQQNPWGRVFVGLLLAQGIYYGLCQLARAALLAFQPDDIAGLFWVSLTGILVLQGLQAVALLVGGTLAGASQRYGLLFGGVVGVGNSLIFVLTQAGNLQLASPVVLYGQPVLQVAFGVVGGAMGMLIWRPLPVLRNPVRPTPVKGVARRAPILFGGRVAWLHVLAGTAVAVAGTLSAHLILELVFEAGRGHFNASAYLEDSLLTWEVGALAMILGGAVGGYGTSNGLKQGLCVGLLTSLILTGLTLGSARPHFDNLLLNGTTALILCLVGGWFGTQLFPPLLPVQPRVHVY